MNNHEFQYNDPEGEVTLPELDDLHEDALFDTSELVSLDEYEPEEHCELKTAGIAETTSVDKFLELQGDKSFVTTL